MLVVKFVPTFSEESLLQSAEEVAWQLRGSLIDGEVYVCIDLLLSHSGKIVYDQQIVKHLMLQLYLFRVGVQGCPNIDHTFEGVPILNKEGLDFAPLYSQLESRYYKTEERGLVTSKVYGRLNDIKLKEINADIKRYDEIIRNAEMIRHLLKVQSLHENLVERQKKERKMKSYLPLNFR